MASQVYFFPSVSIQLESGRQLFFHVFSKCLISPQCQCNLTQLIESLRENRFLLSFVDTLTSRTVFCCYFSPLCCTTSSLRVETHYQHLILCSVKYIFLTFFEWFEKYETIFFASVFIILC